MRVRKMKITIPNRDIDDAAETKDIEPVELDLDWREDTPDIRSPDYSSVIALAATDQATALRKEQQRQNLRDAQAEFQAGQKELADKISKERGVAVGYGQGYAYVPKPKAAYGLWRKVVPLLVQDERTLNTGPTALARRLAANEPNYTITRDMLYDPLNDLAVKDLKRLLKKLGITLKLQGKVTIRSVQLELQARRKAAQPVETETFAGRFKIEGDTAYVNGKDYKIQLNRSGGRRIKLGPKEWLPLDTLKKFCMR
jgi:hypothetical protein